MDNNSDKKIISKFFLRTWFIGIIFSLCAFHPIFFIAGCVLAFIQHILFKPYIVKYGKCEDIDTNLEYLEKEHKEHLKKLDEDYDRYHQELQDSYSASAQQIENEKENLRKVLNELNGKIASAKNEFTDIQLEIIAEHYRFSDYDGLTSEDCKNKLALLKNEEQDLIKSGKALDIRSDKTKKIINDYSKQILRCFNSECDNVLLNLSSKNIDTMRNKIMKSFESLNKIFAINEISIQKRLLELKLEELNLVYTYEVKKEQERELQKAIKEQMIEEEKVRREIETQKAKIEKDLLQCSKEINRLMAYLQKTQNDTEKLLYIDKIKELEEKVRELEYSKKDVLEREANAKAGYVYIISNIGSFGDNIYKIGMTRRLEPMDRIKELSSASVPFEFDVHAMIFSDDAPALEAILHHHFEKQSVNRVNLRKEFFKVSLDEVEQLVKDNFNNTVEFTKIPVAKEYRQTLSILDSEKVS